MWTLAACDSMAADYGLIRTDRPAGPGEVTCYFYVGLPEPIGPYVGPEDAMNRVPNAVESRTIHLGDYDDPPWGDEQDWGDDL